MNGAAFDSSLFYPAWPRPGVNPREQREGEQLMQKSQVLFIVGLIFAILITVFALTNASPVGINLLFYKFTASQALIIFVSAALGAVIVATLGTVRYIRRVNEIRRLKKEIDVLKKEVSFLQSLTEETPVSQNTGYPQFDERNFETEK